VQHAWYQEVFSHTVGGAEPGPAVHVLLVIDISRQLDVLPNFDTQAKVGIVYGGYAFDRRMFIDPVNFPLEDGEETFVSLPLFVEHTLTTALNERNTFLIIKQQNTISFDTGYYYGRLMPAVEHWFEKWISARLGIGGAIIEIEGSLDWGIGGTAGLSFRVLKWGLDIDANVTVRARPSRIVERQKLYEIIPLIIVTKRKPYSSGSFD